MTDIDVAEQLARIDKTHMEIEKMRAEIHETYADRALKIADEERRRQEIKFAPWYAYASLGGALVAAGVALAKLL
jgi:hypothetical protein